MIMSVPSTSSFLSGEESSSALYDRTGRRLAYTPSTLRMPSNPFSGRFSGATLSNSGKPTAPISVASAFSARSIVSCGRGRTRLMNRDSAQQAFAQERLMMELCGDLVQYFDRFSR